MNKYKELFIDLTLCGIFIIVLHWAMEVLWN